MDKDINYLLKFIRNHSFGGPKKKIKLDLLHEIGTRLSFIGDLPHSNNVGWVTGTVVDHYPIYNESNRTFELNECIIPDGTTNDDIEENERGELKMTTAVTYTVKDINKYKESESKEFTVLTDNQNITAGGEIITGSDRSAVEKNVEYRRAAFEYYRYFEHLVKTEEPELMAKAEAKRIEEEEKTKLASDRAAELAQAEAAEPETIVVIDNYIEEEIFTIFMIMDMYKDFILNFESKDSEKKQQAQADFTPNTRTKYANPSDMLRQKQILIDVLRKYVDDNYVFFEVYSKLKELIEQFIVQNGRRNGEAVVAVSSELEVELNKLLGVQIYFPKQMMDKLFPNVLDTDDLYTHFMRFLKFATNNNQIESFRYLRGLSDYYKKRLLEIGEDQRLRGDLENEIRERLRGSSFPKETMAWIEASSGVKKIPKTFGLIEYLNRLGMLSTIKSPGSILDSAGIENDIVRLAQTRGKYTDFKLDRPVIKLLVKTDYDDKTPIANLFLKKEGNRYNLQINDFFGLRCVDFGDQLVNAQDPKTGKISRQSVWDILISLFEGKFRYSGIDPRSFKRLDLCIKSNKTAMDMLKSFFAKIYSDEHPEEDLVSVYNDKNAARFMCSINKKGFVVFYSSINPNVLSGETEERVVIRDEFSAILFTVSVQQELSIQGSQCLDEHCERPPKGDQEMDPGYVQEGVAGPSSRRFRLSSDSSDSDNEFGKKKLISEIKYLRRLK
jgi:hypothetical protein